MHKYICRMDKSTFCVNKSTCCKQQVDGQLKASCIYEVTMARIYIYNPRSVKTLPHHGVMLYMGTMYMGTMYPTHTGELN